MNKDSAIDIITYPDMSHMEDGLLNSLCGLEREVWGYYGEYAVCSEYHQLLQLAGTKDLPRFLEGDETITGENLVDLLKFLSCLQNNL